MLSVNLTHLGRVVVVGGGTVGRRKTDLLVRANAVVTVIDPTPADPPLPAQARQLIEPFMPPHLDDVRLAFACATAEVNTAVVTAARARGVWVCSASDPQAGDFVLPSVVRRGDLTFAVSTGGASPALARRIAADLLGTFDDAYADWVWVLGEVRRQVLAEVPDPEIRRRLLTEFAEPDWLDRVRHFGAEDTLAEMRRRVRATGL